MAQTPENIQRLIRGLFEDKQTSKELDTSINRDSAELKAWMSETKIDAMTVDDIKVTYKPQVRSTMDEGKTLEILHTLANSASTDEERERILRCIHTKEYVDETELENLIYNDIVKKENLEPAMISKTISVLNLRCIPKKD